MTNVPLTLAKMGEFVSKTLRNSLVIAMERDIPEHYAMHLISIDPVPISSSIILQRGEVISENAVLFYKVRYLN